VEIDGRPLRLAAEATRYVLLYKPRGVVSTLRDPQRRPTIKHLLRQVPERVYPVGRLDVDSEGLLLCTNDGGLANLLTHPRHEVWKTYLTEVEGRPSDEDLERLSAGVALDGRRTLPARFRRAAGRSSDEGVTLLEVELREGRKQQIRRMLGEAGFPVVSLRRIAIGPLRDDRLKSGSWRDLTPNEVADLRQAARL
jgi:23S rRNA pseudouridine2605 synthase